MRLDVKRNPVPLKADFAAHYIIGRMGVMTAAWVIVGLPKLKRGQEGSDRINRLNITLIS